MTPPESFEEFWPYYVSQHMNRTSRRLHFVGTTLAMGCVAVSPWVPSALLAAPVCGYGLAWIGHFAFEKNRPATWGSAKFAVWSLRGDVRMWGKMITGTMDAEVARVAEGMAVEAAAQAEPAHA
ncbi:MAG TPA: DUF962 domain-containing protein [Kofleriaceae bacterium]|jgi:hypothetical protein